MNSLFFKAIIVAIIGLQESCRGAIMKSRLLVFLFAATTFLLPICQTNLAAAPVLDQIVDECCGLGVLGSIDRAQTFTVGITGQLTRVDVMLTPFGMGDPEDIWFDVRPTANGVPIENDDSVLAQSVIPPSSVVGDTFIEVDVSAFNVLVNAGDVLAIVLRTEAPDIIDLDAPYGWQGQISDSYPGGTQYLRGSFRGNEYPTWTASNIDLNFRTFVDTGFVPPPPEGTRLLIQPGSYFEIPGFGSRVPILDGNDGLVLGDVVSALPGSFHLGLLDGNPGESGGIVQSYEFLGSTGTFWTESPVEDLGGGFVDMSGWRGAFGLEPVISFDNPTGLLAVAGDSYVLDYDGIVTNGPFLGLSFILHLQGTVLVANESPDCTGAVASLEILSPPNHNMVPISILGVTDPDDDPIDITIDSIFQDEPVDGFGDGRSTPDGAGVGTANAGIRAERSGSKKTPGNGRVYHINFTADDGQGGTCTGEVLVGVRHDSDTAPVDDGALFDSTVP